MMLKNLSEKIRQDKKLLIVLLIGLCGTIILVFSGIQPNENTTDTIVAENQTKHTVNSTDDIEKRLEEKLTSILSQVKGAGNVSAVVSVGSSGEYVYAENIKKESDSDSLSQDSEIVIYESQDGSDSGLVISIKSPDIIGVAIVCEGGESSVVKAEITKLVTSLFGIGSDRVYVGSKAAD